MDAQRQLRLIAVNEFLQVIASCGRQFFSHENRIARFEISANERIWFIDAYSQQKIYTHTRYGWNGFNHGGTLLQLCQKLRDFIRTGAQLPAGMFGPWPETYCRGDAWGYGPAMQIVRDAAVRLKVIKICDQCTDHKTMLISVQQEIDQLKQQLAEANKEITKLRDSMAATNNYPEHLEVHFQ